MEKLYTVNKNKTGADCGSDHELLITKFRLKLKKVGKTTRPFSYGYLVNTSYGQDQELTVAQTMNSLLPNSDLN